MKVIPHYDHVWATLHEVAVLVFQHEASRLPCVIQAGPR